MMPELRSLYLTTACLLAIGLRPPPAGAEIVESITLPAPVAASKIVNDYVGGIAHRVAIDLPAFHGLPPSLSLSYGSQGGNGWVGVGTHLTGLSTIERRSVGLGAPRGDATDLYVLDGEPLLRCVAGATAPSCLAGGTHVLRRSNDARIALSGSTWTVTTPHGVVSTFRTVVTNVAAVSTIRDPFGNQVSLAYTSSGSAYYPASISYNGTVVTFGWETRPDVITVGLGAAFRTIRSRLVSVTIATDGATVRSYRLAYSTTVSGGLSQLKSVKEVGTDNATARPPTTLAYRTEPTGAAGRLFAGGVASFSTTTLPSATFAQVRVGDVNGDGRSDAIALSMGGNNFDAVVRLGTATGDFGAMIRTTTPDTNAYLYKDVETGDFNGDGRTDLVFVRRGTGLVDTRVALGAANGTFTLQPTVRISTEPRSIDHDQLRVLDLDQDGRSDLLLGRIETFLDSRKGEVSVLVARSTGTNLGTATRRSLVPDDGGWWTTVSLLAGDIDGDRLPDLVVVRRHSQTCQSALEADGAESFALRGRGDGTFLTPVKTALALQSGGAFSTPSCDDYFLGENLADVNGDGRDDLVGDFATTLLGAVCTDCDSDLRIAVNLARGDGSFAEPVTSLGWSGSGVQIGFYASTFYDVNGDGLADRVGSRVNNGIAYAQVNMGRGDGTFSAVLDPVSFDSMGAPATWTTRSAFGADLDGDGRPEPLMSTINSTTWLLADLRPPNPFGPLLQRVTLPSGGSITYALGSSADAANTYLPFAIPVVTSSTLDDGVGTMGTTTYRYAGGLYSPSERRFLGFRTAQVVDPTGAYRDKTFSQHVADPDGTLESEHVRTAAGALLRYTTTQFARSGNGTTSAYTSRASDRYEYECNGDQTCQATRRGWTYSPYGAVTSEIEHGDIAVTGDERTSFRTQVVNTTGFLTQLDAEVSVRAGAGAPDGALLAQTRISYDGAATNATAPVRGAPTATSRWSGGSTFATTTVTFDAAGNPLTETTPVGSSTTTAYDLRQRPTTHTNALGQSTTSTYDTIGRLTRTVDVNGLATVLAYDALSRLVQRTTPDGGIASARYVSSGIPAAQYVETAIADGSADGLWRRSYLDGFDRVTRTVDEGGLTRDTRYDVRGLAAKQSAPYLTGSTPQWTTTTYDGLARVTRVATADGAHVDTSYDDWLVITSDELGRRTARRLDAYGLLVEASELEGSTTHVTTTARDLLGRVVGVTDARGNVASYAYDALGHRTVLSDPDLGRWQFEFDLDGRETRHTDARGVVVDLTYDVLGRVLTRTTNGTVLATFRYDRAASGFANIGRLTDFVDPSGETHRDYDAMGRLRSERKTILGTTYALDWTYDQTGRLTSLDYPAVGGVREHVGLTYNGTGRPAGVGTYVGNLMYDARGGVTSATYGNGATVARTYSPTRGWMIEQTVSASGTVRDHFAVTRAATGDITGRTSNTTPRDAWQFTYDPLGRLTAADNTADGTLDEAFTYDPIGDRLTARRGAVTTAYQYPASADARPHAPTSIGGMPVRYDANGNRLGIAGSSDAVYDANNRLVDDGTTTYAYDAEGTRVRAGTKVFVRDLFETDGVTSTRYYYLGKERLARRDQTGAVAYYHGDSIGTVRALTSDAGALAGTRIGFAFGEVASSNGVADPFGLAGQRRDPSGLFHMGARMMDPAQGQFTQPDPSGAPDPARPQSLNRYSYVLNNPIRLADPTGFQEEDEEKKKPKGEDKSRKSRDGAPSILRVQDKADELPDLYSPEYEAIRNRSYAAHLLEDAFVVPFRFESITGRTYTIDDEVLHGGTVLVWPIHSNGFLAEGSPSPLSIVLDMQLRVGAAMSEGTPIPDAFYMEGSGSHVIHRYAPETNELRVVPPSSVPESGLTDIYYDETIQMSSTSWVRR